MAGRWRHDARGYVYCYSGGRKVYQHRFVWESENGPIPPGGHIHHRDGIRDHNTPANLQLVTGSEHRTIHLTARTYICRECDAEFEATSPRGALYCPPCRPRVGERQRQLITRDCEHCGETFTTRGARFCSQRCVNLGGRWAS